MKFREIFLDFTSLLDVFMLILFYFILFSHFEVEEAKNSANEAKEQAQQTMLAAEALQETAESMFSQAEEELSLVENVQSGNADNVKALLQISRGTAIQSKLTMNADGSAWTLELLRKQENSDEMLSLAVLNPQQCSGQEIMQILENQNYTTDSKIPFLLIYNGTETGSSQAFSAVIQAFEEVRRIYPHFYYMEIDISDFEEELP